MIYKYGVDFLFLVMRLTFEKKAIAEYNKSIKIQGSVVVCECINAPGGRLL